MLYTTYFQDHKKKKLHVHYYDNTNNRKTKAFDLNSFTYYTANKSDKGAFKDIWGQTYDKQVVPFNQIKGIRQSIKEMKNIEKNAELFMNSDRKISRLFNAMGDISGSIYNANIGIFDIETRISDDSLDTTNAPSPIVSIALHIIKEDLTYLFAYHKDTKYVKLDKCKIIACRDESDMIMKFIDTYLNKKIDILSGWNCLSRHKNPTGSYDIPYMYNRMINLGLNPKTMSPYNIVDIQPKTTKDGITFDTYFIRGIQILDYMDLYFYMTKKELKRYSLDYVSYLVLKKNKVDYDGNLNDLYDDDIQKFLYYNSVDCTLIAEMDRKLGYFQSYCATGWKSDTNFEEVVNTNIFIENFFHKAFTKRGFVIKDTDTSNRMKEFFEGAYVYANVKPHKYGVNNDFNSMYPWLMIMFNISPETKVLEHEIEAKGYTLDDLIRTPLKGIYYVKPSIKKGIVPDILEELYNERLSIKAKMEEAKLNGDEELAKIYDSEQLVVKIILNSTYGYFGFYKAKYYDLDNARVITTLGQDLIKYSRDFIVDYLANAHTNEELKQEFGNINKITGRFEADIIEFENDVKGIETKSELFRRARQFKEVLDNKDDFEKEIIKIEEQNLSLDISKKELLNTSQIVDKPDVLMLIDTDSCYMQLSNIMIDVKNNNWCGLTKDLILNKKTGEKLIYSDSNEEEKETIEFVNFANKFYDIFDVYVDEKLNEWGASFNTKNLMVFGREKYMRQLISIAKKKYIMDVAWDDGKIVSNFNLKYKGFELTKTDTTIYAKEKITDLIKVIFDGVKNSDKTTIINGIEQNAGLVEIIQTLYDMRQTFKYEDINKISMFGKVSKYKKYIEYDEEAGIEVFKSRTNSRLKASMYHNRFMKDNGLLSKYRRIEDGYKVNVMFIVNNTTYNTDRIAWSGEFPEIYYDYFDFDYNLLFDKTVVPIVKRITDVLKWDLNFDILNEDNIFNAF